MPTSSEKSRPGRNCTLTAATRNRSVFEHRWIHGGKISILDDIYLVHRDGEGEAYVVALDYTEVPAAQLEGLPDLFDKIEREIGVHIVAARVKPSLKPKEGRVRPAFLLPCSIARRSGSTASGALAGDEVPPAGWSPETDTASGGSVVVLTLPSYFTGRAHRLKDFAVPSIFGRRPKRVSSKIGSPARRLWRSLRDSSPDARLARCRSPSSQ
ncbi:MAG: hypothetical protein KF694_22530 [Mesorhizobium sp.]|nr:hypothetical protein [Mesorhizobium sp.]